MQFSAFAMPEKIKILFLAADPSDFSRLRLGEEVRKIEDRIQMAKKRNRFKVISTWAVTHDALQRALLRHKPHIVHFSGHGSTEQGIILEDEFGNGKLIDKSVLIGLFKSLKDNIRIIVLNACYSKPQADGLAEVIDYTVGVQTAISDDVAILFAASFYQALAHERLVKDAFNLANNSLKAEGVADPELPELLMREGVDDSRSWLPDLPSKPVGQPLSIEIMRERREFISIILRITGGAILIPSLYFIWQYISRRERYTRAIDQLSSPEITVRTAAINSLSEFASDPHSDEIYQQVINNLVTFIREHSPLQKNGNDQVSEISSDVQAALKVLGWRKHKWKDGELFKLDLSSTNLKGAVLRVEDGPEGAHLEGALLNNSNLEDAKLRGINLQDAVLAHANLRKADLSWANLDGAWLRMADLEETNLLKAQGLEVDQLKLAKNYQRAKLPPEMLKKLYES